MKCFHVIRNAPAWQELAKDYESHKFNPQVKKKMKSIFQSWDQFIEPNYFTFRDQITAIAKDNHSKLPVNHTFLTALGIEKEFCNISSPYLVLFSDDDDWYNLQVVEHVKKAYILRPDVDAILWNHCTFCNNYKQFSEDPMEPYFILSDRLNFHTNNYVLTDNFFRRLTPQDVNTLNFGTEQDLYYGHSNLDCFFKNRLNILQLPDWMSMDNKNVTSYSFWWKDHALHEVLGVIRVCARSKFYQLPSNLSWADNEVARMMKLYQNLRFKWLL